MNDEKTRGGEDGKTVMEYLTNVYFDKNEIDIFGTVCKICSPTFSSFNKKVREKLNELEIEYVIHI